VESGVIYGPNNDFGCYVNTCLGIDSSVEVSATVANCITLSTSFPADLDEYVSINTNIDITNSIPPPNPISVGVSAGVSFDRLNATQLGTVSGCTFVGLSEGLPSPPVSLGEQLCTTRLLKIDMTIPPTPACPDPVSIRAKSGTLQLTWPPVNAALNYDIARSTMSADSDYNLIAPDHVTDYATYLDSGLNNGTDYWYRVTAKDVYGNAICITDAVKGTPVEATRTRR
jgi:hypothetical protein